MPIKTDILQKYISTCFVETGTYLGDGVQRALDAGFKHVISIELSDKYYAHSVDRFKHDARVLILQGDSADVLFDAIKNIKTRITFWLDGHWSGGETAYGRYNSPLILELKQISRHSVKDHIIMVDDMRCWVKNEDTPDINFTEADIKDQILSINNKYKFSYENGHIANDILIAHALHE